MKIGISSKKHSVIDLSMITYWTIRQRLMKVPGVANVAMWGERIEMLQVQVDPERMAEHGMTLERGHGAAADAWRRHVALLRRSQRRHAAVGSKRPTSGCQSGTSAHHRIRRPR